MFDRNQLTANGVSTKKRALDLTAFNSPIEPIIIIDDDSDQPMPKLKKAKQHPVHSLLEEQSVILTASIKLTIELVPKTSWFDNVRTNISPHYWKKLSKASLEKAEHQCEICSTDEETNRKLECHEIWDFDDNSKTQKLLGLITLCRSCHETKHIGLAEKHGRLDIVKAHLALVNDWVLEQAEKYVSEAFSIWRQRSQHKWKLDISWIETQGIPLKKQKTHEQKDSPNDLKKAIENKSIDEIESILAMLSETAIDRLIYGSENKRKLNPIHEAVISNDEDFLRKLLTIPQLKRYINKADKYGETPLFYAVKNKKLAPVCLLLTHGASVSIESSHKKTVLHHAVNNKDVACFGLLLEFNINELYHTYDNWDKLPFHSLCKIDIEDNGRDNKNDEIQVFCKVLVPQLTKAEITKIDKYKKTLLHYAVSVLTEEHLEYLFNNGASEVVQVADKYGKTALHQAAKWGNIAALKLILMHSGDTLINKVDTCNKTPLHEAAIYGRKEIIILLLQQGAEFDIKSTSGQLTAIEEAINKFGAMEAFALFSPYMNKTEEEKQQYLNELLAKEEQKNALVPIEFSRKFFPKRERPEKILNSNPPPATKKMKMMTIRETTPDNTSNDNNTKTFRQQLITQSYNLKSNTVKAGHNPFGLFRSQNQSKDKEVSLPSKVKWNGSGTCWIREKGVHDNAVNPAKVGKWLLYFPSTTVDRAWDIVKKGVQTGDLWQAKVSTDEGKNNHVIVVYTKDYTNLKDVIRVHDYLTEKRLRNKTQDIYYKTDNQTHAGIYSGASSKQKPWIYSSTTIEKFRIDIKKEEISPGEESFNALGTNTPKLTLLKFMTDEEAAQLVATKSNR